MKNDILCNFEKLKINNKLSKCSHCGMVVESKDTHKPHICGSKINTLSKDPKSKFKLTNREVIKAPQQIINSKNQCSQQQIDSRLSVCKSCEFYQNNTCLKCGCSLSRDRVFMNKLYWPDQSCPIGKWGPVEPDNTGE